MCKQSNIWAMCSESVPSGGMHVKNRQWGYSPKNESFISGRVWDAESIGEGPGCMR